MVLRLNAAKIEKANEKKLLESDSEGSLRDFINDESSGATSSTNSDANSDSDVQAIDDGKEQPTKRRTRNNPGGKCPSSAYFFIERNTHGK